MMGNKRIPIAAKLLGGFGIVLALVAVLGWVSITRMSSIDQGAKTIFEEDLESIVLISALEEEALDVEIEMTKGVLATLMASEIIATNPEHAAELAAEADVTIMDDWTVCQAELYSQLSQQMRTLWHNGNGAALNSQNGAESHVEPPAEPAPVSGSETQLEHWCATHEMAYTQKNNKAGESWWSHRVPDGSWCRE